MSSPLPHESTPGQSPGERSFLWLQSAWPPVLTLLAGTALMELVVQVGLVERYILPPPTDIVRSLWLNRNDFLPAAGKTAIAAFLGFAASGLLGVLAAVLLASGGWVRRAFYPYAVFFQTVPIVAIAPLLVIYVGYGMNTVIAASFIVSFFPVLANALDGLLATDPGLRDLFRLYGAGRWATLWKLRLPAALPQIMTGLRVAAGLAVIGAIVGEFVGGDGGLGDTLDARKTSNAMDDVFALLLLAAGVGIAMFAAINFASRLALRHWYAGVKE
jgi:NitT/TauT family transport system permease protein